MAKMPSFNTADHQPADPDRAGGGEPIRAGWTAGTIIGSEMKPTKDCAEGKCQAYYLVVEFEVSEAHHPELRGRRFWDRLNLINPNPTAVEIAQRQLRALCDACGVSGVVEDSEVLHGKTVAAKLAVRAGSGNYGPSNDVKGYDTVANRIGANAEQPAPATSGSTDKAPWES